MKLKIINIKIRETSEKAIHIQVHSVNHGLIMDQLNSFLE